MKKMKPGTIAWHDLTVRNAEKLKVFYKEVAGWNYSGVDMGGYNDYNMIPPGSRQPMAGVCHKKGVNREIPKGWMVYIRVNRFDHRLKSCKRMGGKLIGKVRKMGGQKFAYLKDPEGNVFVIFG